MRQLPHLNELHEEYADKGLNLVTIYAQSHQYKKISDLAKKRKIKYPIAIQSDYGKVGYATTNGLPAAWIIGADGKLAYISSSTKDLAENLDKEIKKALAAVKYRGLGDMEIPDALIPAAKAFAEYKFSESYKLAEAISDDSDVDADIEIADAIIERIEENTSRLINRFETSEISKNYYVALAVLRELAAHYNGVEDTEELIARLPELEKDEGVKKELAAKDALVACELDLNVQSANFTNDNINEYWAIAQAAYEKVAKDHAGTAHAKAAAESAVFCKASLGDGK